MENFPSLNKKVEAVRYYYYLYLFPFQKQKKNVIFDLFYRIVYKTLGISDPLLPNLPCSALIRDYRNYGYRFTISSTRGYVFDYD